MSGIDRLKEMFMNNKDSFKTLIPVIKYLVKRTDLYDCFLNTEKSIEDLYNYLNIKAKEVAVNNMAIIEDEVVYQWSVDYFSMTNIDLGINLNKIETNEQMELGLEQ